LRKRKEWHNNSDKKKNKRRWKEGVRELMSVVIRGADRRKGE